jgi:hypothetical protein
MDANLFSDLAGKLPLGEAVHTLLRDCLDQKRLASIFEKHRGRSYEKIISFPHMVEMIGDSLMSQGGSAYRTFSLAQEAGELEASKVAAYRKLSRTPIPLSMAFFTECNQSLLDTFPKKARRQSPKCLQKMETVILDGKAIKGVAKRMKALRATKGGLLGGRALVGLHFETGLIVGFHAEPDGDANDSRFVPDLLPVIEQRVKGPMLWLTDRGFCDLNRLEDFAKNGHHFLVRYHKKNGFHLDPDRPAIHGTDKQGRAYTEEWGWQGAENHQKRRYVRRITLIRPDADDVSLVTDLLDSASFPAPDLLDHYLSRWGIEGVFQQVTETFGLEGLIGSTPEATVFQFAFCLLLYNTLQVTRGFIAANQKRPAESISIENIFVDVTEELLTFDVLLRRGLARLDAIPPCEDVALRLRELLREEWSDRWIKAINKKRRAHVVQSGKRAHGSVFRILEADRKRR